MVLRGAVPHLSVDTNGGLSNPELVLGSAILPPSRVPEQNPMVPYVVTRGKDPNTWWGHAEYIVITVFN